MISEAPPDDNRELVHAEGRPVDPGASVGPWLWPWTLDLEYLQFIVILIGFHSDFMGFHSDFMGFYSDLSGIL